MIRSARVADADLYHMVPAQPIRFGHSAFKHASTKLLRTAMMDASRLRLLLVDPKTECHTPKFAVCSIWKNLLKIGPVHLA